MDLSDWQKIISELRKNTQKTANQIYLKRKENILKELYDTLGIDIRMDHSVKKGRPKRN